MNRIKIIDRLTQGKLTRREYVEAMGVFGVTAAMLPVAQKPARAEGDLLYFTWAGFEDPGLFPAYVERWGLPEFSYYGDEYEGIEKLKAGFTADLCCPCIDVMPRWMTSGMHPIDESRLDYLDDTFEAIRSPEAAFEKGERFFVPTYWGFSSFIYRTDLTDIQPEDESWNLLFDEKYKNRMATWDSTDAVIPVAALALGYDDDPYRPDDERLEEIEALLRKQRELMRFYWTSSTDFVQAFAAGEVVIGFSWAGTAAQIREDGTVPFKWAQPKEGMLSFVCGLGRSNRAGDEAAVYDFINASMAPEAGKYMIETFAYGAANAKSFDMVDPTLLAELNLENPEESLAGSHSYDYVPGELKQKHIDIFDEIKAGF